MQKKYCTKPNSIDSQQVLRQMCLDEHSDWVNAGRMQTLDSIAAHIQNTVTTLTVADAINVNYCMIRKCSVNSSTVIIRQQEHLESKH